MAKYIRTKDEIFCIGSKVPDNLEEYFIVTPKELKIVPAEDVIKESENLEDLLDAFLCENKLGQGNCSRDFTELKRNALHSVWQQSIKGKSWDDLQFSFYGLIKRNQDLICVAKYNDETNEWELIQ